MIPADHLLAFAVAAGILIVIPGPSVVFAVSRALAYGRSVALCTVVGNSVGLLTALALVALGLGALVATSDAVYTVLKLVGAVYLVWLGVQALRHRHGVHVEAERGPAISRGRAFRDGYVVGVSNPKGFVIFAALLPQFLDRSAGHTTTQMVVLGLVACLIGLTSDSVWALVASRLRTWFNASPGRGRALGTVGGVSMVGLGVALATSSAPES